MADYEDKKNNLTRLYEASLSRGASKKTNNSRQQNLDYLKGLKPSTVTKSEKPKTDRSFIENVLNVLEGPMQGMYAASGLKKFADPKYQKEIAKDPVGSAVGSSLQQMIPGKLPVEFLINTVKAWTDPEYDKVYGSDVIEGAIDAGNLAAGVDTTQEEDTVNPWVKGIGGFVMDVGLDPLTYIPGAVIAKPFTKGAQIARKGFGLPEKGASLITGKKVSDVAINPTAAVDDAINVAARSADDTVVPAKNADDVEDFVSSPEGSTGVVEDAVQAGASNREISEVIAKGMEDGAEVAGKAVPERIPTLGEKFGPEFKETKTFLAKIAKDLSKAKSAQAKVDVVDKVADLSKSSIVLPDGRRVGMLKPDEYVEALGRNFQAGGITYYNASIVKAIRNGTFETKIPAPVRREIVGGYNQFKSQYLDEYSKGVIRTVDGDVLPLETVAALKAKKPKEISALQLFRERMDADAGFSAKAAALLGPGITKDIEGRMSKKRFDEILKDVGEFLDAGDLDTLRSINDVAPGTQQFLVSKGITEEALQENYARIRAELAGVDETMVAKAGNELNDSIRQIFKDYDITLDDVLNKADESYITSTFGKKTKRTSTKAGKGLGKQEFQLNQYVGTTLVNKVINNAKNLVTPPKINKNGTVSAPSKSYGPKRSANLRDEVFTKVGAIEKALDDKGIPQVIFYGEDIVALRPIEAMQIFSREGGSIADGLMFNHGTLIPPTNMFEAFAYVSKLPEGAVIDEDVLRGILQNTSTYKGKGKIPNALSPEYNPGDARIVRHYVVPPPERLLRPGQSLVENTHASKGSYLLITPEALTNEAIVMFRKAAPALQRQAATNSARYAERLTVESSALMQDEIDYIVDLFETGGIASAMKAMEESSSRIAGKAQAINAMNMSAKTAQKLVEASVPEPIAEQVARVMPASRESALIEQKYAMASPAMRVNEANKPYKEASVTMAKNELDDAVPDGSLPKMDAEDPPRFDTSNVSAMIGSAQQTSLFKKLSYTLSKNFNARAGISSGWEIQHGAAGIMAHLNLAFNEMMQSYAAKFNRIQLPSNPNVRVGDEAMRLVQQGLRPDEVLTRADGQLLAEAMVDAQKIWDLIFTTDRASAGVLGSDYFKSGGGVELLNMALARFGAGSKTNKLGTVLELAEEKNILQFFPDLADEAASLSGRTLYDELVDQVRVWDLGDNPLDTLRTIQASFSQALMHSNVSDGLQAYAMKTGLYSKTPIKGWYQPAASKQSVVLSQMDPNGYYPVEFLEEVGLLDNFLQESRTLDGAFGEFINKTLDPVLDAWKFGMTIIRPGHHVRNAIGDASITYMAEGLRNSRVASVDATRLLAYKIGDGKYDVTDYLAMLNRLEPRATARADDVLATVTLKNGSKKAVKIAELRKIMEEKGLFPSFGVSEDLLGEGTGAFAKVARTVSLQNKFTEKVGGGISQYRDHWARAHHFMQFVRNNAGKYANVDDLYEAAAKRVKRFHPDGSMLTAFESKYMRRVFPFYSWMRGILPGAIEATIKHPGRFMVAPKASFNLAVAMGVDPESLSNPFPTDQMFPSFIREDVLGPQFLFGQDYVRANPGIATLDLLGTFSGGVGQGLISSMNPMFKLPFELNNMTRLDTGSKIQDLSDYLDSQIPNVGPISNITGYSPTSVVENLFKGKLAIDRQRNVEKGNKDELDRGLSFTNWLSGLGTQNLSQPNLINYAEIEARNEAAKRANEEK